MSQELHVARRLDHHIHTDSKLGKETVGEIIDDDADDLRLRLPQVGGAAIIDIAKIADQRIDLFAGFFIDERATLQDQRDSGFRHAGGVRNIHNAGPGFVQRKSSIGLHIIGTFQIRQAFYCDKPLIMGYY